jgi:hypothetical protein
MQFRTDGNHCSGLPIKQKARIQPVKIESVAPTHLSQAEAGMTPAPIKWNLPGEIPGQVDL